MRKLLSLLVLAIVFSACGEHNLYEPPAPDPEPEPTPEPKEYTVSFGFAGEITNIIEMPLTRAATNDVYGIQIYSRPENGWEYQYYAYGVFDDKDKMTVNLLEGYKYMFVCAMVKDGKSKLLYNYYIYGTGGGEFSEIENKFYNSTVRYISGVNSSSSWLKSDGKYYERPNLDRYYGEIENYEPKENGIVSINMKRASFGAAFVAENLTEGKIIINIKEAPQLCITHGDSNRVEDIFAFTNIYGSSWIDDHSETIPVSAYWEKADGAAVPLFSQNIVFNRNKKKEITIKVNDNTVNGDVNIDIDQTPMTDDTPLVIEGGGSSGTIVDPV